MNAEIEWAGEKLVLMPERTMWWPREHTIFIADPHFGKASTFRFAGIPVAETSHDDDLDRLEEVLRDTQARRLVVLGDFFHAKNGRSAATLQTLAAWRERVADVEMTLVLGNHDRHAGRPPSEWQIDCADISRVIGPFICRHDPEECEKGYVLAGHIHPAYRLNEKFDSGLRSPCFHFSERVAVLPAFGTFTGSHTVRPQAGDRIFVVGPDAVMDVSGSIRRQ